MELIRELDGTRGPAAVTFLLAARGVGGRHLVCRLPLGRIEELGRAMEARSEEPT